MLLLVAAIVQLFYAWCVSCRRENVLYRTFIHIHLLRRAWKLMGSLFTRMLAVVIVLVRLMSFLLNTRLAGSDICA